VGNIEYMQIAAIWRESQLADVTCHRLMAAAKYRRYRRMASRSTITGSEGSGERMYYEEGYFEFGLLKDALLDYQLMFLI
jgi:hypothetical protein